MTLNAFPYSTAQERKTKKKKRYQSFDYQWAPFEGPSIFYKPGSRT